jgi:hypothetical protein
MAGFDPRPLALTVPVAAFVIVLGVGWLQRSSFQSDVANCFDQHCFDTDLAVQYRPTIAPFLAGTPFAGKLNTSGPPKEGFLNVYFAKGKLPGRLSSIKCNCAYVGSSTVICDDQFIASFRSAVNFSRDSFYGKDASAIFEHEKAVIEQVNQRISQTLTSWIIGHEIGHAVLHGSMSYERRQGVTEKQELEADNFFIERASQHADSQARQNLSWGITQFIFGIYVVASRELFLAARRAGRSVVIAPSSDNIHPPWLIRALKLGERMTKIDPDPRQQNDFYESLLSNVEVEPHGKDIGSLCKFENLREQGAKLQQERSPVSTP